MTTKKKKFSETVTTIIADDETTENNSDQNSTNLRASLKKIRKFSGVIGYILKDSSSATIDIEDPEKTVEYALLASQAFDSSEKFSELFDLGTIENTLIECRDLKVLCAAFSESTISIFMEKDADHAEILRKISS